MGIIYDFNKKEYRKYLDESMKENDIRTVTGGRSQILNNGDLYIEETNSGRILYIDKMGDLKWEFINRADDGNIYFLSWSRLLYEQSDLESVSRLLSKEKCNE